MIISRAPLRITLGGAPSDVPSYYNKHGGFCINAAINKYVYINVHRTFQEEIVLKYSQLEHVKHIEQIEHPIFREAIRLMNFKTPQLEIASMADIPAGTGLGSSSTFTVALLKALYAHRHKTISQKQLAELACHIEIDILKEPIGKQDQYAASFGGINCLTFEKNGKVIVEPLDISFETLWTLENRLLLFFTGFSRKASVILQEQDNQTKENNDDIIKNLDFVKEMGYTAKDLLCNNKLDDFGKLLDVHWQHKKKRSNKMSNPLIDEIYDVAMKKGALGGKLVGAGGAGFLMFYANNPMKLRDAMNKYQLEEVNFSFDFDGAKNLL
jgi:D-glycero-alpha-D-manno-heptose-7-phosphate kinase